MKKLRPILSRPPYFRSPGLVLAVSGGVDSMVLLDAFYRMRHVHQSTLQVGHINHHTGRFARESQRVVCDFCQEREIELSIGEFEWSGSGNFEFEAARFRRQFLEGLRPKGGWIVLGHHQDDQVETCILALVRGASISSPIGMHPVNESRLRPFLEIQRNLILEHAQLAGVPHLLDASNFDVDRLRNRIRHRILPPLEKVHGNFGARLGSWLGEFKELQKALIHEGEEIFAAHDLHSVLPRTAFHHAKKWIWPFILRAFWNARAQQPPRQDIQKQVLQWLSQEKCGKLDLPKGRFFCDLDGLTVWPKMNFPATTWRYGETVNWGPLRLSCSFTPLGFETLQSWASIFMNQGVTLRPSPSSSRRIRDLMRKIQFPHRFRAIFPEIWFESTSVHLVDVLVWSKKGWINFQMLDDEQGLSHGFCHCVSRFLA